MQRPRLRACDVLLDKDFNTYLYVRLPELVKAQPQCRNPAAAPAALPRSALPSAALALTPLPWRQPSFGRMRSGPPLAMALPEDVGLELTTGPAVPVLPPGRRLGPQASALSSGPASAHMIAATATSTRAAPSPLPMSAVGRMASALVARPRALLLSKPAEEPLPRGPPPSHANDAAWFARLLGRIFGVAAATGESGAVRTGLASLLTAGMSTATEVVTGEPATLDAEPPSTPRGAYAAASRMASAFEAASSLPVTAAGPDADGRQLVRSLSSAQPPAAAAAAQAQSAADEAMLERLAFLSPELADLARACLHPDPEQVRPCRGQAGVGRAPQGGNHGRGVTGLGKSSCCVLRATAP